MNFSIFHGYLASSQRVKYVSLDSGSEQIDKVVDRGSRTWLRLSSKHVIIPSSCTKHGWDMMMQAEFKLAEFLKRNNFFTLPMESEVLIFKDSKLASYSLPSLQRLESEGKYLLDLRQDKNSSWKISKKSFFNNPTEKLNPESWEEVFNPLLDDIAKLIVLGLPLEPRCHCLAITRTELGFVVRYLAQDMFSDPKQVSEKLTNPNPLKWHDLVQKTLESIINAVLVCEFKKFALQEAENLLLKTLVKAYTGKVISNAKSLYAERIFKVYNCFKSVAEGKSSFTLNYPDCTETVNVQKKLDAGAEKQLLLLQNGKVLFIPHLNPFDPIRDANEIASNAVPPTVSNWNRVAAEECNVSQKATNLGLLNSGYKPCKLTIEGCDLYSFTADSFETLSKRGLHVIENGFRTCSWLNQNLFLFKSDEERTDISKWEPLIKDLIQDVILICKYQIPIGTDSLHSAIDMKNGVYQIRYFGFDFHSSKLASFDLASYIFETILEPIVNLEFRNTSINKAKFLMDLNELCMSHFKTRIGLSPAQSAEK